MRVLTFIKVLLPCFLFCQELDYRFENYTVSDGLPFNEAFLITQDNQGIIWIGSKRGFSKFNGFTFETFTYNPVDTTTKFLKKIHQIDKLGDGKFLFAKNQRIHLFDPLTSQSERLLLKSMPLDDLRTVYVSNDSSIWIGTASNGLFHYNKNFDLIDRYHIDSDSPYRLDTNFINKIYGEDNGNVLLDIGDEENQFLRLDFSKQKIVKYPKLKADEGVILYTSDTLNANYAFCSLQTDSNSIWLGTNAGLIHMNISQSRFTRYHPTDLTIDQNYESFKINCLFSYKNYLWCGTENRGIFIFDLNEKQFIKNYYYSPHQKYGLIDNRVLDFFYSETYEDGVLWIGTGNGISKVDLNQKPFDLYYSLSVGDRISYLDNVRTIYSDSANLWVGLGGRKNASLNIINKHTHEVKQLKEDPRDPYSIGNGTVGSVVKRKDGKYWITTWRGWLNLYNPRTGSIQKWNAYHNDIGLNGWVFCEAKLDRLGNYWIGSIGDGLWKIDSESNVVSKHFLPQPNQLPDKVVRSIYIDSLESPEIIWLGTNNGLSRFNVLTEVFENFNEASLGKQSPEFNSILHIYRDKQRVFWLAMDNSGLVKLDIGKRELRTFTTHDGLPSNHVFSVYPDKKENIWMSTGNGISMFNPRTEEFNNYFQEDGILENRFNYGAHCQDKDGKLYFGGARGVTAFYPEEIHENPFKTDVKINFLLIDNKRIGIGDTVHREIPLPKSIHQLDKLTLGYRNHDFALEFYATHYANSIQNSFKYRLRGYDKEWKYTDADNRRAHYTNLPPGTYTFEVMASNADGIWGIQKDQLTIHLLPPWWNSVSFRLFTLLFLSFCIWTYTRIHTYQLKKQKEKLEFQVKEKTNALQIANLHLKNQNEEMEKMAEKLREQDRKKTDFYENISHEFRTPLTLILGPVSQLIQEIGVKNERWGSRLFLIKRNAARLLRLINQLLDISALDTGVMKLSLTRGDLISFLEEIVSSFQYQAGKSNKEFKITCDHKRVEAYFDPDKLEKILYNLISNALKFTGEGESIHIEVHIERDIDHLRDLGFQVSSTENYQCCIISVTDTGMGIPEGKLTYIFKRFYRIDHAKTSVSGIGIGLSLTKELVEKHKGQIKVESKEGIGSAFTFFFPINKESYENIDGRFHSLSLEEKIQVITTPDLPFIPVPVNKQQELSPGNPILLLVEDNKDMQNYVYENLKNHYRILLADDGEEAYRIAFNKIPDIIVCDVMMPKIDGIELCGKIKRKVQTSHIPFIYLTAKSSIENQVKALEQGAEDFISKPFHIDVLRLKIQNILNSRHLLQDKLRTAAFTHLPPKAIPTSEEKFLGKVITILNEHYANPDFGAENLAKEIGFSRAHLYRKIKALTDQSISEFIRTYRLNKGIELLKQGQGNVSEVAFQVGFSSPSYFSTTFKKQFGQPPQSFVK